MMNLNRPKSLRSLTLVAACLLASACGSDADGAGAIGAEQPGTTRQPVETTVATGADGDSTTTTRLPPLGLSGETEPLNVLTFGGLSLTLPVEFDVVTEDDIVRLRHADGADIVISRVSHTVAGDTISSVSDLLEAVRAVPVGDVEQRSDVKEIFGIELQGYAFRGTTFARGIFPARPAGVGGNMYWSPGPNANLYLAEVVGGVVAVGVIADSEAQLSAADSVLDSILAGASLTNGSISDLGGERVLYAVMPDADWAAPEERAVVSGTPLGPADVRLDAGRYIATNTGIDLSVDIPAGWMPVLNRPGFVVLVPVDAEAPGDRDIIFHTHANALSGVNLGLEANGEPLVFEDATEFIAALPPSLEAIRVDDAVIVAGFPAVEVDLRVKADATCAMGDPCAFVITSPLEGFIKDIKPGTVTRIWWIDTGDDWLVVSASVSGSSADWLDAEAAGIVASLAVEE